ncbi:MAG: ABC transporter substrate-binding protein, partial [Collinsella sp.]
CVMAGLGLTGCGGSGAESGSAVASGQDVEYRDELQIALPASPDGLDPHTTSSLVTMDIICNVVEPLFGLDSDYEPQPVLAKDYEVSDDGLTYTIKLREGVTFHNGKELGSEDVVASMNRWLTVNDRAASLLPGATFAASGDHEVTCTLTEPAIDFLIILGNHSQYPGIFPSEVIEAAGDTGVTEYVGTGAYKFVEWKQDQYVHLTRYEDYVAAHGKASGYTGKVSAPTKDIYYQFVTEASTRVSGFETGEYDVAGEIPTENYHDFDGNDDVKLYTHNAGVLTAFLNMNEGVFADEEIRKCALMAIDCEAAALAAYGEKELFNIDPNLGNPENTQWATDAGKKYFNQADAKAAKKALAKTSYAGETVKLLTTPDYKDMYNATVALQEQLEKAGFTAEVDSYEFATFMDIRSSKPEQWDLLWPPPTTSPSRPSPSRSPRPSMACPTRRRSSSWPRPAPPRTPTPRPRSGPRLRSASMRSPSSSRFATTLPSRAPRQTSRTSRCSTAPSSGTPSVRSNAIDDVAAGGVWSPVAATPCPRSEGK